MKRNSGVAKYPNVLLLELAILYLLFPKITRKCLWLSKPAVAKLKLDDGANSMSCRASLSVKKHQPEIRQPRENTYVLQLVKSTCKRHTKTLTESSKGSDNTIFHMQTVELLLFTNRKIYASGCISIAESANLSNFLQN